MKWLKILIICLIVEKKHASITLKIAIHVIQKINAILVAQDTLFLKMLNSKAIVKIAGNYFLTAHNAIIINVVLVNLIVN